VDAFHYDSETSDPLYKHIPFFITLSHSNDSKKSPKFYGSFYDNLSTSVFDMGKEVDALRGMFDCFVLFCFVLFCVFFLIH